MCAGNGGDLKIEDAHRSASSPVLGGKLGVDRCRRCVERKQCVFEEFKEYLFGCCVHLSASTALRQGCDSIEDFRVTYYRCSDFRW